jgi:hypothetical protein
MPLLVANGAMVKCSFGATPTPLTVLPSPTHPATAAPSVLPPVAPLAVVTDMVPTTNLKSFGLCSSPANPAVQAATAAKLGVFSPAPCVPLRSGGWAPASSTWVAGVAAFSQTSACKCQWLGVITVVNPGQATVSGV